MFGNIFYTVKQAFVQIKRNGAMSFASVFSITAMLLILGLFFIAVVNVNVAMSKAEEDYQEIQIYLLDATPYDQAVTMMDTLDNTGLLESIKYCPKEDALNEWKKEWGENAELLDSLPSNPLPNAIVVRVADLYDAGAVVAKAKSMDGVESVRFYQDTVDKLVKVTKALQTAAWVIMIFLIVVCIVVVSNTIKLTVFARSDEIHIMKYVGATNWFIRGPFLLEGMLIGLVSALVAAGINGLIYNKLLALIGMDVFMMFQIQLVPLYFLLENLVWIFIAIGIAVGACGSIISMRRFLDT